MGGVVDFVGAVVGAIVGTVATVVDSIFGTNLKDIISPLMAWLGFGDEEIEKASVTTTQLFNQDLYSKTMRQLHVEYMKKGYGSIDYAKNYSRTGETQLRKYDRLGDWEFSQYLPKGAIQCTHADTGSILAYISNREGTIVDIINITPVVPDNETWSKVQIQNLYDYNIDTDVLALDNQYYSYGNTSYDTSNNRFIVVFNIITDRIQMVSLVTSTTVDTSDIEGKDLVTITVERRTILYKNCTDTELYTNTDTVSTTEQLVDTGTVTANITVAVESETVITVPEGNISLTCSVPVLRQHYYVTYSVPSVSRTKYTFIDPSTTGVGNPTSQSVDIKMLPIVALRINHRTINDLSEIHTGSPLIDAALEQVMGRPDVARYTKSKKLLHAMGIDIDDLADNINKSPNLGEVTDAFFILGICPNDGDEAISKALYEVFNEVYLTAPYIDVDSAYSLSVKEGVYNSAIAWRSSIKRVQNGKIRPNCILGTHSHSVMNFTTTITTKYLIQTEYVPDEPGHSAAYYYGEDNRPVHVRHYTKTTIVQNGVTLKDITIKTKDFYTRKCRTYCVNHEQSGNYDIVTECYHIGTITDRQTVNTENSLGLRIKKQITDNTYEVIDIPHLKGITIIRAGKSHACELELGTRNFLIPIPTKLLDRLTLMEKTALLGKCIHMSFYSVHVEHLEWYETEKFRNAMNTVMTGIMVVVVIVVTVSTWGTMTTEAVTLSALLTTALKAVLIAGGVQLALHLISTYVDDPALKAALSMAVMTIGVALSMGADFGLNGMTALELGASAIEAANIYTNTTFEREANAFQSEVNSFNSTYNSRSELMEKVNKTLNSSALDALDLSYYNIDTSVVNSAITSPTQFFNMALGNIATNYDLLYTGMYNQTITDFVSNRKQIGIGE